MGRLCLSPNVSKLHPVSLTKSVSVTKHCRGCATAGVLINIIQPIVWCCVVCCVCVVWYSMALSYSSQKVSWFQHISLQHAVFSLLTCSRKKQRTQLKRVGRPAFSAHWWIASNGSLTETSISSIIVLKVGVQPIYCNMIIDINTTSLFIRPSNCHVKLQ